MDVLNDVYFIRTNFFDPSSLTAEIPRNLKDVPAWLGTFRFSIFGGRYDKKKARLPHRLDALAEHMKTLHPEQDFNTTFLQVYKEGEFVRRHRDPRSNIGRTLIAIFGDFDGAMTKIYLNHEVHSFYLRPGDVLSLPCTIDGIQGPPHEVTPVTRGTRYALILNTVLEEPKEPSVEDKLNDFFS